MNDPSYMLQQIITNVPAMLVYLAGIIVSFLWISRIPVPSILTLLACGLMLLTRLLTTFFFASLNSNPEADWMRNMAKFVSTGSSLVYVLGVALLLLAVFIGRNNPYAVGERKS